MFAGMPDGGVLLTALRGVGADGALVGKVRSRTLMLWTSLRKDVCVLNFIKLGWQPNSATDSASVKTVDRLDNAMIVLPFLIILYSNML